MPYTVREQFNEMRPYRFVAVRYAVLLDDNEPIAYTRSREDAELVMNILNESAEERIDSTVGRDFTGDNVPYAGESA